MSQLKETPEGLTETGGKVSAVPAVQSCPVVRCGLVGGDEARQEDGTGGGPPVSSPRQEVESLHPLQHSGQGPVVVWGRLVRVGQLGV